MKKFFAGLLRRFAKSLDKEPVSLVLQVQEADKIVQSETKDQEVIQISSQNKNDQSKASDKKRNLAVRKKISPGTTVPFSKDVRDIRDVMEMMEVPFVALSKNRTEPIIYESTDGLKKVRISRHHPHYVASIYDWDIILFVSSKLQGMINSESDIPPRTLIIPRQALLKEIHRHAGKKEEKDLKASLSRLQTTAIETTICNKDGRYDAGFGFIDSWGYTDRKDIREFRITLSEWLYKITCNKGSLLKVSPEYFKLTSGLKRFLYRTARKHVGTQNDSWVFSLKALYEKSGSEQEFKKFKYDLKRAVADSDIPDYFLEWVEEDGNISIRFVNMRKESEKMLSNRGSMQRQLLSPTE